MADNERLNCCCKEAVKEHYKQVEEKAYAERMIKGLKKQNLLLRISLTISIVALIGITIVLTTIK